MVSRLGAGFDVPAVRRVRQVESGPAARSSGEVRQAGAQAAAVVRIGAEARARAAASAAEAQAAASAPRQRPEFEELAPLRPRPVSDFASLALPSGDASGPRVTLEQFTDQLARAKLEQ